MTLDSQFLGGPSEPHEGHLRQQRFEMVGGRRAFRRDMAAETMTASLKEDSSGLSASSPDLSLAPRPRSCLPRVHHTVWTCAYDFSLASLLTSVA
jgi:hypothetical protein